MRMSSVARATAFLAGLAIIPMTVAVAADGSPGGPAGGPARPKVAALEYTWDVGYKQQMLLAPFGLVLLDKGRMRGAAAHDTFVKSLKTKSPGIRVAQYVINGELRCEAKPGEQWGPLIQAANDANWWLRKADGTRAQWTKNYAGCDINPTEWGGKNALGQSWMKFKWIQDRNTIFGEQSRYDYVFVDNIFNAGRSDGDWRRNGRNESAKDPVIAQAWRRAFVEYFDQVRATNPELKLLGNSDNDLSAPEYKGQLNGALLEAMHGKDWSIEALRGWEAALRHYQATVQNTREPHDVVYEAVGGKDDYAAMRFGLATALLDDGWYMYRGVNPTDPPWWYDEYDAPIGTPAEPTPKAPMQGGAWGRRYTNGYVLVNPQKTGAVTVALPAGFQRLSGKQDPTVNDGQSVTQLTLPARAGLVLIRK